MAYIDGIMEGEAVLAHSSTRKETIQDLPLITFEDVYIE
jgi:hypothetical protein